MNTILNNILRVLIFLIFFSFAAQGALTILGKKLPENAEHFANLGTFGCLVVVLILVLAKMLPSLLKNKKKPRDTGKKR